MTQEEHRLSILAQVNQQSVALLIENLSRASFENERLRAEAAKLKSEQTGPPATQSP